MRRTILAAAFLAGAFGTATLAHHGLGGYDLARKFTIQAQVRQLKWQNPHVHIWLEYEKVIWTIVLPPISSMKWMKLTPESVKEGTKILVEGYPSRRVEHEMLAVRIRVGGHTYELH
jgi:uncharacterized protein DUF6152